MNGIYETSRRTFLGAVAGGIGAAVALRGRTLGAAGTKAPLGLQLWSLRNELQKDLPGTLKQIRGWGLEEVESAGFYGGTAETLHAALKAAGLRCRSMHRGFDELTKDFGAALKDAETVGATTITNPYLPHESRPFASRDEILRAAESFRKWAEQAKAAGKRFAYHTHSQEFGPAPEGTLFDVLVKESGPDVGFEFDIFWIVFAGADPVTLMKKLPGRVWFTHLKDMAKGTERGTRPGPESNVVLGTGTIDVAGVVAAGKEAGVEINYIEDESADPVGHIPESVAWYKAL